MRLISLAATPAVFAIFFNAGCGGPEPAPAQPAPPQTAEPTASAIGEPAAKQSSVTIYRDTWGVPHIYADTDEAAVFGLGYAQAEDRLADLLANVRTATGTAAEVFGPEFVQSDMGMQIVRNAQVCETQWSNAPEPLRVIAESFVAGVNEYIQEHPDQVPEWADELQPWHCAAIGRAMILRWPLETVFEEMGRANRGRSTSSNEWAVAPSRSAENCAILLTDPHLNWEGMAVFYEARVHGDQLHMNGFFIVGSPLLGFGHTQYVGWAPTTGGPDTSDVFELKVDLSNMLQPKYEYNGQWKTATPRIISVKVKDAEPRTLPTADTEFGPVIGRDESRGIVYVAASPYFNEIGVFEQTYRMLLAKNTDEFYEALGMNHLMEQNIMFADTSGNIQYVRNGRTPIRAEGYDWTRPVPATPETIWKAIHPIADLVQIKNPPQGYMQNCNISPANMMKNSPLTPDKYRDYIYNVTWDRNNPRSKRIVELLDADDSVTREDAIEYATNVYDILAKPWQQALAAAVDTAGADHMKDEAFASVVKGILAWDGQFTTDSTATAAYKFWRLKCSDAVNVRAIADGVTLAPEAKKKLLDLLAETISEMKARYGTAEIAWGELHRVGRSGRYFPAPGADFGASVDGPNFTETLFDVRSKEDPENPGKFIAYDGSGSLMLMFLHKDGIESYTCVPWGQSAHPDSPHHLDQAEHLFSQRTLKPTWWRKEDLLPNVKAEKVLTLAQ